MYSAQASTVRYGTTYDSQPSLACLLNSFNLATVLSLDCCKRFSTITELLFTDLLQSFISWKVA